MIKKNLGAVTAYAIAKKNGFVGTEQEWLDSLQPKLPDTLVQTVDQTFTEPQQMQARKNLGLPYSQTNRVILPETEFSLTAGDGVSRYYNNYSPARPFGEPEVGRTYTVNLNGTEYEVTAEFWERGEAGTSTYSSGVKLGHVEDDIHAGVPENPAYPFGILTITDPGIDGAWGSYLFVYDNVSSATLSITEIGEYIHKLDKKFLPDDIGGPVNWSDIPDKPFTTVGGDTLTWDGNTEGLVSVEADGAVFYRISAATPSLEEIRTGTLIVYGAIGDTGGDLVDELESASDVGGIIVAPSGVMVFVAADNTAFNGITFPKKGIYVAASYEMMLTIPGYTGFTKEVINEDVLPEALRFGEALVNGDTLTWDGKTAGLEVLEIPQTNPLYKVSDTVLTENDLVINGFALTDSAGNVDVYGDGVDDIVVVTDSNVMLVYGGTTYFIASGTAEAFSAIGMDIPTGTYFGAGLSAGLYIASLTINGYTGFKTTAIKPIQPKYLPGVLLYADADNYLYEAEDTSDTTKRITAARLEALANSMCAIRVKQLVNIPSGVMSSYTAAVSFSFANGEGQAIGWAVNAWVTYYTAEYTGE